VVHTALCAITIAAGALFGARNFRRRYGRPPRRPLSVQPPASGAVDVRLPAANGLTLRGWFIASPGADRVRPAALVMHGWGGSAADMAPLAGPLLAAGMHVLLLDARCHGRSDDDEFVSMPRFAEDLESGLTWLRQRNDVDRSRLVLVGHSVGAGAGLLVASRDNKVAAVVSIASLAHPKVFMARTLGKRLPGPLTTLALRYVERTIGHRFETFAPVHTIGRVQAPVLLVHGDRDTTVPVADAYELHAQAPERTQLVIVKDADHTSIGASIEEVTPALHAFLEDAGVTAKLDGR
jgi:dipeptidyl aminopeptidase/acylaminoacyl peptidase